MRSLLVFVLAFAVALPASAQTTATFQAETSVRATTSNSSAGAAAGGSGTVTTQPEEASDMFLDIKGVEGESEAKKGNVEHEWKVEEGESAAGTPGKPKYEDINIGVGELQGNAVSVSAVEVRGWDPKQKQEFLATVKAHAQVQSGQDLENFAKGVLLENENMEEISLNFEKIKMKHRASGKLFGFIPVSFTETVEIDSATEEAGRIKVKFPWFAFLIAEDISAEEIEAEIGMNEKWMRGDNENWNFGAQAEIMASISNVLKTKHDTVKNSINNIR